VWKAVASRVRSPGALQAEMQLVLDSTNVKSPVLPSDPSSTSRGWSRVEARRRGRRGFHGSEGLSQLRGSYFAIGIPRGLASTEGRCYDVECRVTQWQNEEATPGRMLLPPISPICGVLHLHVQHACGARGGGNGKRGEGGPKFPALVLEDIT
jgi:hypothetical protein